MTLLDQNGKPYPKTPATKRSAEASVTGLREQTYAPVTRGITPDRMASILDAAAQGEITEFLSMAEEMEEKDLHFFSLLSTRKLAITGAPRNVEPFDESPRAKEISDLCAKHVVNTPEFAGLLFDLLDALSKGFAAVQPVWNTKTRPWTYKEFYYTDPRWFKMDTQNQDISKFLLCSETHPQGEPIPPGRFVFHFPKIKSGLAIRGGLARMAAITYMFKVYTLKDWLAFMEVFGMPVRVGKYDPDHTTDREKATLLNALRGLGHDAAAMIPEGMDIEVLDASRASGSDSLFGGLAAYLDKQISKGILGQTMTSDDGASLSQAIVHQMVRQDILDADSEQLEATINKYIIEPWTIYNFGEGAPVPKLKIQTEPPEDKKVFTQAALPWVKAGLKVDPVWVREKFGIPEPTAGAKDLLGETQVEEPPTGEESPEDGDPPGGPKGPEVAKNAAQTVAEPDALDGTVDALAQEWERELGPHRDVLQDIAANSTGYEDFLKRLSGIQNEFNSDMFVRRLAVEMAKIKGSASA